MAEGTGFEPVIMESKSNALDQTKLTPSKILLERVERIELSHNPWQGPRLPLHHTRIGGDE